MQGEKQRLTESLRVSQTDLTQYQTHSEQLTGQLTAINQQLVVTTRERDEGLRKGEELTESVATLQSRVNGLEAQAEQLEQDRFTTQGALDTLEGQHQEVHVLILDHSIDTIATL